MVQAVKQVKTRGIRHTIDCTRVMEPQILGCLALRQLMWTCPVCGRFATVNPMDEDNPW